MLGDGIVGLTLAWLERGVCCELLLQDLSIPLCQELYQLPITNPVGALKDHTRGSR